MTECDACNNGTCVQELSLFDTIVLMAKNNVIADGEEETYDAGYHDGQIAFARELCKILGIEVDENA
jgi:hypothetical protein